MNNFKRIVILITHNLRAKEMSLYFYKNFIARMMTIGQELLSELTIEAANSKPFHNFHWRFRYNQFGIHKLVV